MFSFIECKKDVLCTMYMYIEKDWHPRIPIDVEKAGEKWLVVLRLNVPVNNFSVMSGRSHRFLGK